MQPTQRRQAKQATQATHLRMNIDKPVAALPETPALAMVAKEPATAALPTVAMEPATAALATVAMEPATAALAAVAREPATATLPTGETAPEPDPGSAIAANGRSAPGERPSPWTRWTRRLRNGPQESIATATTAVASSAALAVAAAVPVVAGSTARRAEAAGC